MITYPDAARRAVLLGVGNILLSDEGVGVRLVERYAATYRLPEWVQVLDGGTCAMEMLEELENLDLLIIADCVRVGQPPASLVVLKDEAVPAFFRMRVSPHQVGLSDVLATLHLTERAPKRVVVIGVQPVSMDLGMELTSAVQARLPEALAAIRAAFDEAGVPTAPHEIAQAA
jgi:hydrogenase maturation protease